MVNIISYIDVDKNSLKGRTNMSSVNTSRELSIHFSKGWKFKT